MKKILLSMAALLLLPISALALVASSDFSDINGDEWYADAVDYVAINGWMTGNDDGTFAPENPLNRAEMATVLERYDSEKEEILNNLITIVCLNKSNFLGSVSGDLNEEEYYSAALDSLCNEQDFMNTGCYDEFDLETGEITGGMCE